MFLRWIMNIFLSLIKKILQIFIAIIFILSIIHGINEIIIRSFKFDEAYVCRIVNFNDERQALGPSRLEALRISWPVRISELWIRHAGRAHLGSDSFETVFEGDGDAEHLVSGFNEEGRFELNRLTEEVEVLGSNVWVRGTCRRRA